MKALFRITPVLLVLLSFIGCSKDRIKYEEHIIDVYFDPENDSELIISTSTLTNDSDYIVANDGSEGYTVLMERTSTQLTFEFIADEHIEHLQLLQYKRDGKTEYTPFKELGTGHFILTKPIENFNVPATGYYKFTVLRYTRDY